MPCVSILQELVGEHLTQRRRDVHRETRLDTGLVQRLKNENERQIDLGYGLVEPVFLEEFGIFGMPDKGQMGVQDEAEIPRRHTRSLEQVGQDRQDAAN